MPLTPSLSPSDGERVAAGRVRGFVSVFICVHPWLTSAPAFPPHTALAKLSAPPIFSGMKLILRSACLLVLLGCAIAPLSGCKSAYYATYEKFGVYKRDLLKKYVVAARDDQQKASEQFKDALTKLKEVYAFDGGKLEKSYRDLESEYKQSADRAAAVHKRVTDVEVVGTDLFKEWEGEIKQITTPSLAEGSRKQLRETRAKFDLMLDALKKSERSMDPVLTKLHDQVLYLKHNLNAAAIASLRGESTSIQGEISKLIADMNASIAKADEFIKAMQ